MPIQIHALADVKSSQIGAAIRIWQFVVILPNARIGADFNIFSHVLIENDVVIGDRITVKSGVQLWDGLRIEDYIFIGPNVTFTNDPFPRNKQYPAAFPITTAKGGASIGGGSGNLARHHDWSPRHDWRGSGSDEIGAGWSRGGRQPSAHRPLRRGGR
jgi:UDP-2-acetamido-3-amino-2,3-dideoxy-glucuronate N-acetyltransferase